MELNIHIFKVHISSFLFKKKKKEIKLQTNEIPGKFFYE